MRFPQLPPSVLSSSVPAPWPVLRALGCDKSAQNESFNCEEPSSLGLCRGCGTDHDQPSRQQGVLQGKIVTSEQPGLFLTKFYCKFLLKDILVIYKL